ncbi:MAG TPA: TIGR03842 family LLM class F420-dependent oxidoreductase [Candidatus Limnocylindrales bacterium]|nr:TIGR03842 family LLM class F420-dependent oxidoreductase [Candidatus Limnocylindrales bacterium]
MEFAFTLKPDHSLERVVSLTKLAERCGFTYGWVFDSHVLWKEPYVLLTLMAQSTERMRLGTCVTNPATREPSVTASTLAVLQILSAGRMDLGIGRGDSARRVLGKPPTTLADLEEATRVIRELCEGRAVEYEGRTLRLPWAPPHRLPVWVAGYGPKALGLTGRIADGAVIQIADPSLVAWCVGLLREGARGAGRDPNAVRVMVAAPAHVGPRAGVRERVRWFPALVSNHVVDLVKRYGEQGLPADLTAYVRGRPGYDYRHHAESGSSNAAFVDDESVDRFCVIGEPEEHVEKLRALAAAGMSQFNLYLMSGEEERILELYGEKVIPALREVRAAAVS